MAGLDEHLHPWDEQFHALVAKNMMYNPLKPMLYANPVLPYDYKIWVGNHVWLHKQPLFLWQMAASMKIFGINVLAVRLPSVLFSSLLVFFIYRIGKLFISPQTGYFAALLYTFSYFSLEIISGSIPTDHNDIAFMFYAAASIWAWVEFEHTTGRKKWMFLILIGLFSGAAVLVKWLVGLLVFSAWGISIILSKERRTTRENYYHISSGLLICFLVFVPWQIYAWYHFPKEYAFEMAYNSKHLFEVVEGHSGGFWWHFEQARSIYGVSFWLLLPALILAFIKIKEQTYKIAFAAFILVIYLFFGIVASKMQAFTYPISCIMFIALGSLLESFVNKTIQHERNKLPLFLKNMMVFILLFYISFLNVKVHKIEQNHVAWKKKDKNAYELNVTRLQGIKLLPYKLPNISDYVIFNCKESEQISIQFFTSCKAAYSQIPTEQQIERVLQTKSKIAIIETDFLPEFIREDQRVKIISL
jgi:4-amino-4-deoxy-L-arabinose transferase